MPSIAVPNLNSHLPSHAADPTCAATLAPDASLLTTVDTVIVLWPEQLVHLAPERAQGGAHGNAGGFLLGQLRRGAPHEIAVVVLGLISDDHQHQNSSHAGLSVVGRVRKGDHVPGADNHPHVAASLWLEVDSESCAGRTKRWTRPSVVPLRIYSIKLAVGITADPCQSRPTAITVVYYRPPNGNQLQYFAAEPLRLGPVSGSRLVRLGSLLLDDATVVEYARARDSHYHVSALERKLVALVLLDPARWSELAQGAHSSERRPEGSAFRSAIDCINETDQYHRVLQSATRASDRAAPSMLTISTGSMLCWITNAFASFQPGLFRMDLRASPSHQTIWNLLAVSASARQLETRLSQLAVVPRLASRLRTLRKRNALPTRDLSAPYIGLWNSVWLIANDLILGYAISTVLVAYHRTIAETLRVGLRGTLIDDLLRLLVWLGDWPAGLKLNTELSLFFQDAYSSFTQLWKETVIEAVAPRLEATILSLAMAGRLLGFTMTLCLVSDLLGLLTLHITAFHACSRRTLRFFMAVLSALFDLFRGKKRNALRGGRLDSATYELDQLLLGTILFTLCAFLLPTVYVFHLAFAAMRLATVAFEAAVLDTLLGLLNHLPLFALMLRLKDPNRLPAGLRLDEVRMDANDVLRGRGFIAANHFVLRSNPLGVAEIFEGYSDHVRGILDLPRMLKRALVGEAIR